MTTNYAIHANGTFWGQIEAETPEDAMFWAAEEWGTEGNTDGLTARPIGSVLLEMRQECEDIDDLIREWANSSTGEMDDDANIWIGGPQSGHWADADKKADFIDWFERKVRHEQAYNMG